MWHSQAERLGGLQIDDQLERRRLLEWQLGGVFTFVGTDNRLHPVHSEAAAIVDAARLTSPAEASRYRLLDRRESETY